MSTNNQVLIRAAIEQEYNEIKRTTTLDQYYQIFTTQQVLKKYDLDYDELEEGITDGGNDGGCDGIYVFVNDELVCDVDDLVAKVKKDAKVLLYIIQAKNVDSFKEDAIDKWKTVSQNLLDLTADYSSFSTRYNGAVLRRFSIFRETYINLVRRIGTIEIKYIYITNGVEVHPNVIAQARELESIVKQHFTNAIVSVAFCGANELMQLLNTHTDDCFYLKHTETIISPANQVYVLLVRLSDYYQFITNDKGELKRHIFESNVRDYQGHVTVNKEIQNTLESNDKNEDFWWLNNGVTILATTALPIPPKQLKIHSPEIVNGLQTSSEIYNYFNANPKCIDNDSRCILVRVIVPESDESRDRIILATNNQTTIPKASLRATDAIHRQIEMYFKMQGLFYDRRKNYYKNHGKPAEQIVSISFLSQCLMSILLMKPDFARARPSTLLSDNQVYKKLFNEKYSLEIYYNLAFTGKKIIKILRKSGLYSISEIANIQFYVLYYVVSSIIGNTNVTPKAVQSVDLDRITEQHILLCAKKVHDVFISKGGTDKLAKGSELVIAITTLINHELSNAYA